MTLRIPSRFIGLSLLAGLGCDHAPVAAPRALPELLSTEIVADTASVLRALVRATLHGADSAAVRWQVAGSGESGQGAAFRVAGDTVSLPVLGLFGATRHQLQVVAWGAGQEVAGPPLELMTGPLPADLPVFAAGGPDPHPGYVAFQSGRYGLVIDNTGRVVWYHRFSSTPGLNFQVQPNGRYVVRPPGASSPWTEIDPMGVVTRTFGCARGQATRFHDLILEPGGGYWTMCDDVRTVDLSALGGRADAVVTGTAVQHISASGLLLFAWTVFDHLSIADLDPIERSGAAVNWTHGNAIALDGAGSLFLSLRNLSEVLKINTGSGAITWRLGGSQSQLLVQGVESPLFLKQHGLRIAGFNSFVLLDNLGEAGGSRVEWYEVDEGSRTARLLRNLRTADGVVALQGGTTQLLPEGRVLVAYGNGNRVEEYDAAGRLTWSIQGNPGYVFRAERITSLYHPGQPLVR